MKVIILAGGWGSRLGQLSEAIPKPMVEIGQKPIIWHIMKIYSNYGFKDFIIALGVKGNIIKDYFYNFQYKNDDFTIDLSNNQINFSQNIKREDWKVTLVNTGLNTLKGGRIKRLSKFLDNEINMLTYGDGLSDINIKELLDFHLNHQKMVTITGVHPPARFGELHEKDGEVVSFEEKPQASEGLINGGFMIFNRKLLDLLTDDDDCDFEFNALEKLSAKGEVMVYKHKGNWECMDNERDVEHLNKVWREGRAFWKVWS